jgi:signal transduction histidine kinase
MLLLRNGSIGEMMTSVPFPKSEADRLRELHSYAILDTPADPNFDALTELASLVCGTPISLISLVDAERQWSKSSRGLELRETARDVSFCSHCVAANDVLVVSDAHQDRRFVQNPLVLGHPNIRFYAGTPIRTPSGACLGTLCVIDHEPKALSDVQRQALENICRTVENHLESHRKALEFTRLHEQLKRTNENLTTFMRAASHDLRGPLRTIMLMAEAIQPALADNPKATKFATGIHDAASRARRLVDDLLTHARVDAGEQRGPVDLERCVSEVCADLEDVITTTKASVSVSGLSVVQGSATAWLVIMKNLIENALKYTPRDRRPVVRIIGAQAPGLVKFDVIDNACGIDPEWSQRIFEPLVRFHSSDVPGSGIGLATVHKLVTQMGGTIEVCPGDGTGSIFTVAVPIDAEN